MGGASMVSTSAAGSYNPYDKLSDLLKPITPSLTRTLADKAAAAQASASTTPTSQAQEDAFRLSPQSQALSLLEKFGGGSCDSPIDTLLGSSGSSGNSILGASYVTLLQTLIQKTEQGAAALQAANGNTLEKIIGSYRKALDTGTISNKEVQDVLKKNSYKADGSTPLDITV